MTHKWVEIGPIRLSRKNVSVGKNQGTLGKNAVRNNGNTA